ncbi:MAG: hypothetical protein RL373_1543 [Pseudomonadota bacterium]|jgi:tripartite-type tricarboxylate transporter receptor subunit TctC
MKIMMQIFRPCQNLFVLWNCLIILGIVQVPFAFAWPDKNVQIIVPFPPGGSSDVLARAISQSMSERLGKTFIVENKAGATGTIGTNLVVKSPPDGYTLLVASLGPYVIAPHLIKNVPYDPTKDLDAISLMVQAPNVMVVPASSPHQSVADVLNHLKKNPNKMSFASSGAGSSDHLSAELFWLQTGSSGIHVPYKGGAPAITDLIGAQIDISFQNINSVIQHIRSGKLRALAITSDKRSILMPNVPTLNESGVTGANVASWQAIAAPRGLPMEIKKKLHAAVVLALEDKKVRENFSDVGFEIISSSPEQFTEFMATEYARWKKIIETRNIKVE